MNLNVPAVPLETLRGVRRARISTSGIVKSATGGSALATAAATGGTMTGGSEDEGEVHLTLGTAIPTLGRVEETEDPGDDAALIAAGYATLTPIVGVHEDTAPDAQEVVRAALGALDGLLGA